MMRVKKSVHFDGIAVIYMFVDSEDRRNYDLMDKARFKCKIQTQFEPLLGPILLSKLNRISELKKDSMYV